MADIKISEMPLAETFHMDMYIPVVDDDILPAEDRNVRITLRQLFGSVTGFTATTYAYGDGDEFGPWYFIFRGTVQSTFTLPAGTADITNMPIYFANLGTAELLIEGNGSDAIQGADPFSIPGTYDKKFYCLKWTGATDGWVVQ